jgi:hypothetical protein
LRLLDGITAQLELDKSVHSRDRSKHQAVSAFTTPDAAFRSPLAIPSTNSTTRRHRHVQNI